MVVAYNRFQHYVYNKLIHSYFKVIILPGILVDNPLYADFIKREPGENPGLSP